MANDSLAGQRMTASIIGGSVIDQTVRVCIVEIHTIKLYLRVVVL